LQTSLIVGFALFAMFFGAGNIIFPPYIGVVSGGSWFLGFIAYFFADIGLALLAILALLRSNTIDRFEGLMARLGYWPSRFLMLGVMFSIGFIAGPRTATVSFELGLKPIMGESANLAVYSGLYFFIAWLLTVKESKMVDYIGKYLTPTLVGGLIIMIVIGIVNPIGEVSPAAQIDNVWYMGLMSGYQTLDAVAALAFAFVISQDLANKGYATPESKFKAVVASSLVVGVLMFIVYGGLCYLGATASMTYGANVEHGSLVVTLFQALIGQSGAIVLGIIVTLACLTTGMALMGAPATFLVRLSNGRLKYNVLVTMLAFAYAIIANIGLSNILAIAVPVILILYPAVLVMVVLSLFDSSIKNANIFKISVGFALIFSVLEVMKSQGVEAAGIIEVLPLQEHGFGWILPAALGAVIGFFVKPAAE
jgi:LIVCS family branched-chain amino acid:cation transporter